MEKTSIKENYEYWYFLEQGEFYRELESLLSRGYQISDSVFLCVEVCKNNQFILLSYLYVPVVDEHIKDTILAMKKTYSLIEPNYNNSMLNVIASIQKHFGKEPMYTTNQKIDELLDKGKYQNIVVLLLDGLGENILNAHLGESDFLRKYHDSTAIAVFPSTTAAATTSIISGLAPIETGWTGWENYISEINRNVILFNGKDYFTEEQTDYSGYRVMPYFPFYKDLNAFGTLVMPQFGEGTDSFSVFSESLNRFKQNEKNIQYVYCVEPDSTMHEYGAYSQEANKVIYLLNQKVDQYAQHLPANTLLLITADHGHTNVKPLELYHCDILLKMLKRKPCNDSRAITFSVKEEYKDTFPKLFQSLFGAVYDLYPSEELIEKGYFGKPIHQLHPRIKDFMGDYMAIATNEYYFNYKNKDNFIMKSHHAGMTSDEMLVPLIIYRR